MSRRRKYQVMVTYETGVVHAEHPCDHYQEAENYARSAVEDYCPRAEVMAIKVAGHSTGAVLSTWDQPRLDLARLLESIPRSGETAL